MPDHKGGIEANELLCPLLHRTKSEEHVRNYV